MVQTPLLISLESTSSRLGSSQPPAPLVTERFCLPLRLPRNWSAKPHFSANFSMMAWSVRESNRGSITFSRHWSERFEAVTEP